MQVHIIHIGFDQIWKVPTDIMLCQIITIHPLKKAEMQKKTLNIWNTWRHGMFFPVETPWHGFPNYSTTAQHRSTMHITIMLVIPMALVLIQYY